MCYPRYPNFPRNCMHFRGVNPPDFLWETNTRIEIICSVRKMHTHFQMSYQSGLKSLVYLMLFGYLHLRNSLLQYVSALL